MSVYDGPCYKCNDRYYACHDTCEKYAEFKAGIKEYRQKMIAENESRRYAVERSIRFNEAKRKHTHTRR